MLLPWNAPVALLPASNPPHKTHMRGNPPRPVNLPSPRGRGAGGEGVSLKSRGILYVTPCATAQKTLPVEIIPDPLEQITGDDLAPTNNLRDWLLWKILNMSVADYVLIPYISAIIARTDDRTYAVFHQGNITTIIGNSHGECLVKVFTWLSCVCVLENTVRKAQATHLFLEWCREFGERVKAPRAKPVTVRTDRREAFLTDMLCYEPCPICITLPGLFPDMPLWEMLVDQLQFGQFIHINQLCAILARPARDTYWLLYQNRVHEFVREKNLEKDDAPYEQTTADLRDEITDKVRLLVRLQTGGVT